MKPLIVKTMLGMGDNLWSRPHILALARQYSPLTLITPWPQCYVDLAREYDVRFGRATTRLRTQTANVQSLRSEKEFAPGIPLRWANVAVPPHDLPLPNGLGFRLAYKPHEIVTGKNHHDSLEDTARPHLNGTGISPLDIAMQIPDAWQDRADALIASWSKKRGRPVVLVRPPTVRSEWHNPARNCDPRALQTLIDLLRPDYTLISFASLVPGVEWLAEPAPQNLDLTFYGGELSIEVLLGLVRRCWVIGANGFTLPMTLAVQGHGYILFGGNYGHNAPDRLLHPCYDTSKLGYSEPDAPCVGCTNPNHDCPRSIDPARLVDEFNTWRSRQEKSETLMGAHLTSTEYGEAYYLEHRAAGLDYLGHGEWQRRYGKWLSDVFGWKNQRILDIGCACGSIVKGFHSAMVRMYGIDINDHMIRLGQREWPHLADHLWHGDAAKMHQFVPGSLHGLHCAQVAEHWHPEQVPQIIAECRRVVQSSALFFCCMDTAELYERQNRNPATEDPTHYCIKPMDWWREQFAGAFFRDVTDEYRPALMAHPLSMLAGSSSDSPAKYDWDYLILEAI